MANPTGINGSGNKPFRDALRLEIAAAGTDSKELRRVARALLTRAGNGDVAAINTLIDRLDGKVPQPVGGSDELGPTRLHISWQKPNETDGLQVIDANQTAQVIELTDQSGTKQQS